MPSKFTFMNVMPRENFGELFRFFPKGLKAIKIQTKFKSCLLPEFVIQIHLELELVTQRKIIPFYLFCHPKRLVNFGVQEGQFCQFKNPTGREKNKF
jgi:hypothetical protein